MELTLSPLTHAQVSVTCDGQLSHSFELKLLAPGGAVPQPLDDPAQYGQAVFGALFPAGSPARRALDAHLDRLLLVTTADALQVIPWEYARGPQGYVALDCHFVRGLPVPPPELDDPLHIVAVPSQPLHADVPALNIDNEWGRLDEEMAKVPGVTLERTRPPTLEQLRQLLAGQKGRVVHFMGHGGKHEGQAGLLFEDQTGDMAFTTAQDFVRRVGALGIGERAGALAEPPLRRPQPAIGLEFPHPAVHAVEA